MTIDIEKILNEASKALKNKTFGGVTNESAMEAIKKALEMAKSETGKEIEAVKGKSAQEIATMTSQKDSVILTAKNETMAAKAETESVKNAAKAEIDAVKEEATKNIKAANRKSGKLAVAEKQLKTGNKLIIEANQNGAKMFKEVDAEGNVVRAEVKTLDGRKKVLVDTTKFEKSTVEVKNHYGKDYEVLTRHYADGKSVSVYTKGDIKYVDKFDKDGILRIQTTTQNDGIVVKRKFDERGRVVYSSVKNPEKPLDIQKVTTQYVSDIAGKEKGNIRRVTSDYTINRTFVKDAQGFFTGESVDVIKFPQSSEIEKSVIQRKPKTVRTYNSEKEMLYPEKETVYLKDGTKAVFSEFGRDERPLAVKTDLYDAEGNLKRSINNFNSDAGFHWAEKYNHPYAKMDMKESYMKYYGE